VDTAGTALTVAPLPRRVRAALVAVPAAFLLAFYAWPVLTLLGTVVDGDAIERAVHLPGLGEVLWFTVWQAVVSTVATVVVGLGPAYLVARWQFPGRRLLAAAVTVPFLLPTVVVGAAFTALLPASLERGAVAVIVAHVFFNVAVVVRVVGALWSRLPSDLTGAARVLGAGPWQAFRLVTLPLLRPAVAAAASITFLFTFTSFGAVQILGGPTRATVEVEVARRALQRGDVPGAAVLSLLQLVVLAVLVIVSVRVQRRGAVRLALAPARRARAVARSHRIAVAAGAMVTAVVMGAPLVALALSSVRSGGRWSLRAWTTLGDSPSRPGLDLGVDPLTAIGASLRAAALATAIAVAVGGSATLAIAAARRSGRLLDVGTMLPLGTSAVTIGFGMFITFDHAPVDWRGDRWLIAVGHALVAVPFVVRATLPVLRNRPTGWIDAASVLGAPPLRAWWEIDVRLLRRPLLVGAGFAAAISLGEFGATTLLSRTGDETLPLTIARLLGRAGDLPRAQASVLALMLAVVTLLVLLAVDAIDVEEDTDARSA
jgi:thiamine transport system permease protein